MDVRMRQRADELLKKTKEINKGKRELLINEWGFVVAIAKNGKAKKIKPIRIEDFNKKYRK